MRELGIPPDHPTWVALALPVNLPGPLAAYPPILLPGFNEEKYVTQATEVEDGKYATGQRNEDAVGHGNKLAIIEDIVAEGTGGVEEEGENHPEE